MRDARSVGRRKPRGRRGECERPVRDARGACGREGAAGRSRRRGGVCGGRGVASAAWADVCPPRRARNHDGVFATTAAIGFANWTRSAGSYPWGKPKPRAFLSARRFGDRIGEGCPPMKNSFFQAFAAFGGSSGISSLVLFRGSGRVAVHRADENHSGVSRARTHKSAARAHADGRRDRVFAGAHAALRAVRARAPPRADPSPRAPRLVRRRRDGEPRGRLRRRVRRHVLPCARALPPRPARDPFPPPRAVPRALRAVASSRAPRVSRRSANPPRRPRPTGRGNRPCPVARRARRARPIAPSTDPRALPPSTAPPSRRRTETAAGRSSTRRRRPS